MQTRGGCTVLRGLGEEGERSSEWTGLLTMVLVQPEEEWAVWEDAAVECVHDLRRARTTCGFSMDELGFICRLTRSLHCGESALIARGTQELTVEALLLAWWRA